MKIIRKRLLLVGVVAVLLLTVAVLSKSGRSMLTRGFSIMTLGRPTESALTAPSPLDLEQRVRTRHGWNSSLLNSVITGQVTFYNREGQQRGQANFTLYRKYPDLTRVVIDRGGSVETVGFDNNQAWKLGSRNLSEGEARDVRAWLRLWPERLFTVRSSGALYREAGQRVEDSQAATPWQAALRIDPPAVLEQIEMEDTIGPAPDDQSAGDRRSVYYYIDQTLLIKSARWLEPDDPRTREDDPRAAKMDSRVDFANWLQMVGVMWPMQITRWRGGNVEFRIEVSDVQVNQPLADSLFQNSGT